MTNADELYKRVNDAGIRLVMTEIDSASSLLARIDRSPDPAEKARWLAEARSTIDFASWCAHTVEFPASQADEVSELIHQLRDRVRRWSAKNSKSPAPAGTPLATSRRRPLRARNGLRHP
jgi:hypothetical protein